jgi:hypothetical protein
VQIALAFLVSLLPAVVLLVAVWLWLFRRHRPGVFWAAVGFGVVATVAALLLQLPLIGPVERSVRSGSPYLLIVLVIVALIEESSKYAAWRICLAIFRRPVMSRISLATGCGAAAALAFAAIENLLFNIGIAANLNRVNWDVAAARGLATVPLHATTGFIIGMLAWRIHARRRGFWSWVALIGIPFSLHASFNLIQAIGGTRRPLVMGLGRDQWLWVVLAGVLVWVSAALAIRYFVVQRRRARRHREPAR